MLLRNSWFFAKKGSVSKTFPTQPLSFDTDVDYRWHENVQWCNRLGNWSRRISLNRHKQRRGYLRKIAEFVYDLVCLRYYLWINYSCFYIVQHRREVYKWKPCLTTCHIFIVLTKYDSVLSHIFVLPVGRWVCVAIYALVYWDRDSNFILLWFIQTYCTWIRLNMKDTRVKWGLSIWPHRNKMYKHKGVKVTTMSHHCDSS